MITYNLANNKVKQKRAKEREKNPSYTPGFELQATQCLVERHTQSPPRGMDFLPLNLLKYLLLLLGPYLVIISFSSTARILLKLLHGKPLFTLRMLRRTCDTKLL